jgi:hypothetical protein
MKIRSKWGRGEHAGQIISVVNGKKIFVHLCSSREAYSAGNIAANPGQMVLSVLIDKAQRAADRISDPFIYARSNDVVAIVCENNECHMAALAVLGLGDA